MQVVQGIIFLEKFLKILIFHKTNAPFSTIFLDIVEAIIKVNARASMVNFAS